MPHTTRTRSARGVATRPQSRVGLPTVAQEGRLSYRSGRGPRTVVVRFAVADGRVLIRLPEYHEALGYADDETVSLTADRQPDGRVRSEPLTVTGTAHVSDSRAPGPVEEALDECWPTGVCTHLLTLSLSTADDREQQAPPLPVT
jgi:hypothetical protein